MTWAFATNGWEIRDTVVVDHRWLIGLGGPAAMLFAVAFVGLLMQRRWSLLLLVALALFDIVGEFIAQGKLGILITVSFIVAVMIFILALIQLRRWDGPKHATGELRHRSA